VAPRLDLSDELQAALPSLRRAGGGSIINISSTAGLYGPLYCFAYVATKWAIRGMSKAAALELAPDGIRVNSVHPGTLSNGPTTGDVDPRRIPQGRFGEPAEVAGLVAFLASDAAAYITGSEYAIDGGEMLNLQNAMHRPTADEHTSPVSAREPESGAAQ
jgi:3alpha(or 20beta)-hydroxysteroid dehydrogenase